MNSSPIGVFDSGVGGLSLLRELRRLLPNEDFIYYGDRANAPYGAKTHGEILEISKGIVDVLLSRGAKAIVVACNTATAVAIEPLRAAYPELPIIGIEPSQTRQSCWMQTSFGTRHTRYGERKPLCRSSASKFDRRLQIYRRSLPRACLYDRK